MHPNWVAHTLLMKNPHLLTSQWSVFHVYCGDSNMDLTYGLPGDWKSYATAYNYMDWGICLKAIFISRNLSGEIPWNHQVLFFDVHDFHYHKDYFDIMKFKKISHSIQFGEIKNNKPNGNGNNNSLKVVYNSKVMIAYKGL